MRVCFLVINHIVCFRMDQNSDRFSQPIVVSANMREADFFGSRAIVFGLWLKIINWRPGNAASFNK